MAWEIPDDELSERTEIGAGAFGVVMRTRWRGTIIAMKQLHRHLHHDDVAKAEFRTELKLMRQLHHPHIVQFLGTSIETDTGLVFTCTWIPLFTRLSSTSCLHSSSNPLSGSGFLHTTWTSAPKPE